MLRIHLLGELSLEHDGVVLAPPTGRPARTLLGWLALHPGPHPRAALAARLWPDVLDSSARASLRSAAWALRGALGPAAPLLEGERDRIGLRADGLWVDANAVAELVRGGRPAQAVELAERGELLPGLDDDWVVAARDEHRDQVGAAFAALADAAADPALAVRWARRLAAHDPLGEGAHRRLLRALAAAGDPTAALEAHRRFADRLRRELAVAPSAATRQLAEELRAGERRAGAVPAAAPPPAFAAASALSGRDLELAHLRAAWGHVRAGQGRFVLLEGEPGIGKTRLAGEILAEAEAAGARTAVAAPPEVGDAPLALWAELLHDLCRDVAPAPGPPAWVTDLATLSPAVASCLAAGAELQQHAPRDPELARTRLLDAIAATVAWTCEDRPVVLLLDDLHLADAPSLEALARVARRVPRLPVLVVVTRRELPRRPELDAVVHALATRAAAAETIALGPLPAEAVAEIARSAGLGDAEDVERVVDAAEGNALLATASARALARGEAEAPATLRGVVRADAARLDPHARRLADLLAIAGRDLGVAELDALELPDRDAALHAGVEAGLLRGVEGRVGYRHALLRDAVAQDLPEDRRAALHEDLAAALARVDAWRPERSAEIAHHLRAAGRDVEAVDALRRAAAQARALGAMPEALAFLAEAAQLAPRRAQLRLEYAAALAWLGREQAAMEQFDRALADIPPGDVAARAAAWVARGNWYRSSLCVPHQALPAFRQALGEIDIAGDDVPVPVHIQALAGAAWAEALIGDVDRVDALIEEIRRVAGPAVDGDEVVHEIGHAQSTVMIRRGRFTESYAPAEEAAEAALRVGRLDMAFGALGNAACAAACAGDLERALGFADRIERAARDGSPPTHVEVLATRAILLARMGRHDEARAEIAREEEIVRALDDPVLEATAAFDHGIVALAAGEDEAAAELLDRALRGGAKCSRPSARLARAEALARLERCDEAEAELRATALEPVGPADQPDTLVPRMARLQGLIAAHRGDRELAARRLREAVDGWRRVTGGREGERYAALLMDVGRLPLGGMVMPAEELARAEHDLEALDAVVR